MIYPYKCNDCDLEFQIIRSVEEYSIMKNAPVCPLCRSKDTKRVFYSQGVYVQFKGDGFTKSVKEEE